MGLVKYKYVSDSPLELECGETLSTFQIVYHSSVAPEDIASAVASGRRLVWICHALTANSDPSDWWPDMVGEGLYFDPDKDIIICANTLGSCYGTTGPSTWGGKPLDFPKVSIRDLISAHIVLRKHLGVEKIELLLGGSVGGYQAVEWAIAEHERIERLVMVACNERITPWATAFNEAQRMALRADSTFLEQRSLAGGTEGLKAARAMALISYRSYDGYNITQSEKDDDIFLAQRAVSYQQYQGQKLVNRFDAYTYNTISLLLDSHNVGRNRGGTKKVLNNLAVRTLLVGIDTDILFPAIELEKMAVQMPNATYSLIKSSFGHDGFLIEYKELSRVLDEFLNA